MEGSGSIRNIEKAGDDHVDDSFNPNDMSFRRRVTTYWQNEFQRRSDRRGPPQRASFGSRGVFDDSAASFGGRGVFDDSAALSTATGSGSDHSVATRKHTNGGRNEGEHGSGEVHKELPRDHGRSETSDDATTAKQAKKPSQAERDEITKQEIKEQMEETARLLNQTEQDVLRKEEIRSHMQHADAVRVRSVREELSGRLSSEGIQQTAQELNQMEEDIIRKQASRNGMRQIQPGVTQVKTGRVSKEELRDLLHQGSVSHKKPSPQGSDPRQSVGSASHTRGASDQSEILLEPGHAEGGSLHVGDFMALSPRSRTRGSVAPRSPTLATPMESDGMSSPRRHTLAEMEREALRGHNVRFASDSAVHTSSGQSGSSRMNIPRDHRRSSSGRQTLQDLEDEAVKAFNKHARSSTHLQRLESITRSLNVTNKPHKSNATPTTSTNTKVVVILMVGLPGSGKSTIARAICDHYNNKSDPNSHDDGKNLKNDVERIRVKNGIDHTATASKSNVYDVIMCHHIEYDSFEKACFVELQKQRKQEDEESLSQLRLKAWKVARRRAIEQLEQHLLLNDDPDDNRNSNSNAPANSNGGGTSSVLKVVILDDNFHLRSMRKQIHRFLWDMQCESQPQIHQQDNDQNLPMDIHFGIIYVNTPLKTCQERNSLRNQRLADHGEEQQVAIPDHVITKMYDTIETIHDNDDNHNKDEDDVANNNKKKNRNDNNKWETTSWFAIDGSTATTATTSCDNNSINNDVLNNILNFIESECRPIIPVIKNNGEQDEGEEDFENDQEHELARKPAAAANKQQKIDMLLRQYVQTLCQHNSQMYGKVANIARKQMLQQFKTDRKNKAGRDGNDGDEEEMAPSALRDMFIDAVVLLMDNDNTGNPEKSESTMGPVTSDAQGSTDEAASRPGAFRVAGTNALARMPTWESQPRLSPTSERRTLGARNVSGLQQRRTSDTFQVAAVLVHEDNSTELSQREREIHEKEAWLREQMAKLSAWEQKLERKQQQLEQREETVVEAVPLEEKKSVGIAFGFPSLIRRGSGEHLRGGEDRFPSLIEHHLHLGFPSLIRRGSGEHLKGGDDLRSGGTSSGRGSDDGRIASTWEADEDELDDEPTELGFYAAEAQLGPGPTRFAQKSRRSIEQQLEALSPSDRRCFKNLQQRWQDLKAKRPSKWTPYTDEMILRFARNTARKTGFYEDRAFGAMKKMRPKWATLSIHRMEPQLLSKTLFQVPGLKSQGGYDMFYMRPSRYVPKETSTKAIIENLAYVMNCMLEKESSCRDGIGFLACMDDWKMRNFEVNYCYQFMMTLQGYIIPVRVQLFLIVNPPSWFGAIWKIMKPMLVPSFRKKVKMIHESLLPKYLQEGFESFLPDDMESGTVDTEAIVKDFVAFRKHTERSRYDSLVAADVDRDSSVSDQLSQSNSTEYCVTLNDAASYSSGGQSGDIINRPVSHHGSLPTAGNLSLSHSNEESDDISCHVWSDDEDSIGSDEESEDNDE